MSWGYTIWGNTHIYIIYIYQVFDQTFNSQVINIMPLTPQFFGELYRWMWGVSAIGISRLPGDGHKALCGPSFEDNDLRGSRSRAVLKFDQRWKLMCRRFWLKNRVSFPAERWLPLLTARSSISSFHHGSLVDRSAIPGNRRYIGKCMGIEPLGWSQFKLCYVSSAT